MSKTNRSPAWIVTTHVLTTGLAIPTLMGILCLAIISFANIRNPLAVLYFTSTFTVLGYVGGTLYSLAYLRKTAACEYWIGCTMPSIVIFAVLDILTCALRVVALPERTALPIGIVVASSLVGVIAFAVLTESGFSGMPRAVGRTAGALESESPAAARSPRNSWLRKKLLAACVGCSVGIAVGLGISIYMDRDGLQPRGGWQTRLMIALVVGGIGALLGLVSGSPQK